MPDWSGILSGVLDVTGRDCDGGRCTITCYEATQSTHPMPPIKLTQEILAAALEGFEAQLIRIDARIAEIRQLLHGRRTESATRSRSGRPRKRFSAATRRKMALAQRARWAKIRSKSRLSSPATAEPVAKAQAARNKSRKKATVKKFPRAQAAE